MMKVSSTPTRTFPAMMVLVLGSTLVLSGCQMTKGFLGKRDNGSLEYQESKKLAPLELPVTQQPAAFVPLYTTPNAGVNTLTLQNEAGKQYQLPKPQRAVAVSDTSN
ncbi:MAG: putative lipoprotein [Psychrobacter glaciei]|mgnify:CR=1 FL=1|jgi:uncharacterized lipoprotein|uniref:Outer membrane protein assembly factor BamC n=1 Tax=Psychrobacter glaciei TaxID=619771 RepID=A0ABQ3GQV8_9GAMM|nr:MULTISPECIES: hypothetical protein [Psychrobacter]MCH1782941.1 hypothetical protein [Psychrobacter glaciei]GHD31034.1 hypothetical protein GCM10016272_12620 [Psychrobacter glaciei]